MNSNLCPLNELKADYRWVNIALATAGPASELRDGERESERGKSVKKSGIKNHCRKPETNYLVKPGNQKALIRHFQLSEDACRVEEFVITHSCVCVQGKVFVCA